MVETLRTQTIFEGNEAIAQAVADLADVLEFATGAEVIKQDADDIDVFFILCGAVKIVVSGREVNFRRAGQHVGEMALIDPKAKRSASVVASETTVVAKVSEPAFTTIAETHPRLWRLIALELGERLRQRNALVKPVNAKPVMFVGSSAEALPIAREIQTGLGHDNVVVRLWTDGVFGASKSAMESLAEQVDGSDFAVLVLAPDDRVISREREMDAPRDNVIFELGLFMGFLKRERTFLVVPRGADIKIPSDLLGIKALDFVASRPEDLPAALGPVCNELRNIVKKLGPK